MSVCESYERTRRRRVYRTPHRNKMVDELLYKVVQANAQGNTHSVKRYMHQLAIVTGAQWYLNKVQA